MGRGITAAINPTRRRIRGLIFDFGGVVIKTPFELLRGLERRLALAPHTLDWHGPFAPDRDALWEAATARLPAVILTNDLAAFHGAGWFESLAISRVFDRVVDGSITGILKPDARAYAGALSALDLPANETLFVDDQPRNVAGGAAAGLHTELFDVTQPAATYDRIRRTLATGA